MSAANPPSGLAGRVPVPLALPPAALFAAGLLIVLRTA